MLAIPPENLNCKANNPLIRLVISSTRGFIVPDSRMECSVLKLILHESFVMLGGGEGLV